MRQIVVERATDTDLPCLIVMIRGTRHVLPLQLADDLATAIEQFLKADYYERHPEETT